MICHECTENSKNYCPVNLLSVISKNFKMHVINRLVNHLKKCGNIYAFQYGFRSYQSTVKLLTVVSDWIFMVFCLQLLQLNTWYIQGCQHGLQVMYLKLFHLFSVKYEIKWFWIISFCKNMYLMLEFLKARSWFHTSITVH